MLAAVRTHHVSAYVERLTRTYRAPTVKQHLAAIRMLFDWLAALAQRATSMATSG